jgi:hypothetical protein
MMRSMESTQRHSLAATAQSLPANDPRLTPEAIEYLKRVLPIGAAGSP